ncbi:hypothetical protein FACS1894111_03690 [Clostridia bacterium]|nr:hypothetical protein FACS1894111_03690 [Clostridia bacterium]
MPPEFWEKIAADYSAKGYEIFTNAVGDELPICGTWLLNIPLSQMISAAEYAGTFIGIRSGLCDVLHSAKCHKTIVFPDCFYSTTLHKVADFFMLPGWDHVIIENK